METRTARSMADRFSVKQIEPINISYQEALALSDAYALLTIGLKLSSKGLANMLQDGQVAANSADIAGDLKSLSDAALADAACGKFESAQGNYLSGLSSLREAYTNLFTNPLGSLMYLHEAQFLYYKDDPQADVGLSPRMFVNPSALSVERIVKKAGLSRSKDSNESADHLATEMELMSKLFAEKAHLRQEAGVDGARQAGELALDAVIREFTHYHCAKWHLDFFEQLSKSQVHPFFDGLGNWGLFTTRALFAI